VQQLSRGVVCDCTSKFQRCYRGWSNAYKRAILRFWSSVDQNCGEAFPERLERSDRSLAIAMTTDSKGKWQKKESELVKSLLSKWTDLNRKCKMNDKMKEEN